MDQEEQRVQIIDIGPNGITPQSVLILANLLKPYFSSGGTKIATAEADRALGGTSTTQVFAHGLGKTPTFFRMTGFSIQAGTIISNVGSYDGTTMNFVSISPSAANWGTGFVCFFTDGTNGQKATVTLDATNVTLTWTKVATGFGVGGTLHFIWEAQ